jgi:pimeloyl-ACP methyl ester carboxylesterase
MVLVTLTGNEEPANRLAARLDRESRVEPQFVEIGTGSEARRIAVLHRAGSGPTVVWLGGFRSEMRATKAHALDAWAEQSGRAFLRFDYSGHGASSGRFEDGAVGRWKEEALAVIARFAGNGPVFVGSSMGGHIALLAALALRVSGSPAAPSGLVLIAPAVDFTEALMWAGMPPEPYPITHNLIEEGRKHLLLGKPLRLGCPVHILQGGQDPDVPPAHAELLLEHLPYDPVTYTLIPDGDHRLSREQDIAMLIRAAEGISG